MESNKMVSEQRNYKILTTDGAKEAVIDFFKSREFPLDGITFGLPEVHDRYDTWNVPLLKNNDVVGEIAIDAYTGEVNKDLSSKMEVISARLDTTSKGSPDAPSSNKRKSQYVISELPNMVIKGRAEVALTKLPEQSIDLIFTSPPYYNARKAYSEFATYNDYLGMLRDVIRQCKRVLIDGKFFVINSSHVLVPRAKRSESSTRIAVPFDIHQIFMEEGFEFIDDIIWKKPEGAGWASGRGRRFAADRNPLQYKAVPVTEYVMVYRKKSPLLIDHFIRNHPDQEIVAKSKIDDGYEKTNVWYISPMRDKRHPAVFPTELANKVISYYSFLNDVVLDPFAGIGTTAKAARALGRRFCMVEMLGRYIDAMLEDLNHGGLDFEETYVKYHDWSHLEPPEPVRPGVEEVIALLRSKGISEAKILKTLGGLM